MQSIIIFLGIALICGVILSNFLECSNKNNGDDFKFKDYIKNFKLKNIDIKFVFIFLILFEIIYKFIPMPNIILYIPVIFALILTFCLDIKYMIIPDTSSIIIGIVGILNLILNFSLDNCINSLIGLIIGGMFFLVINFVFKLITKKTGFGFGDIKLLASIGLFFGYKNVLVVIIMSVFLSAAFGIMFLIVNYFRKIKEEYLPFGPFIVISTLVICIIPGDKIISLYIYLMDYLIAKLI